MVAWHEPPGLNTAVSSPWSGLGSIGGSDSYVQGKGSDGEPSLGGAIWRLGERFPYLYTAHATLNSVAA